MTDRLVIHVWTDVAPDKPDDRTVRLLARRYGRSPGDVRAELVETNRLNALGLSIAHDTARAIIEGGSASTERDTALLLGMIGGALTACSRAIAERPRDEVIVRGNDATIHMGLAAGREMVGWEEAQ